MTHTRPLDGVVRAIRQAGRIALACHVSPDGDTVGSALALRLALEALGKETALFCQDKPPQLLHFLPGVELFRRPEEAAQERFDLLLAVDVSDMKRLGACAALLEQCGRTAQIDHHGTNPGFAQENCVDGTAPAAALVARELIARLGVELTADMAACLYAGLSTDTSNFSFGSTTAEAFRVAAELVEAGLPLGEINRLLYRQREACQLQLMSRALSTLTFYHGGRITSICLTRKDFEECGAQPEHAEALVNYALDIIGVQMCVFARETDVPGSVKLSLRAVEPARVNGVAMHFGGGGHAQAAGATMHGPLDSCLSEAVAIMKKALDGEL